MACKGQASSTSWIIDAVKSLEHSRQSTGDELETLTSESSNWLFALVKTRKQQILSQVDDNEKQKTADGATGGRNLKQTWKEQAKDCSNENSQAAAPKITPIEPNVDLSSMKVADLRQELRSRGLDYTGRKKDLIDRFTKVLMDNTAGIDAPERCEGNGSENTTNKVNPPEQILPQDEKNTVTQAHAISPNEARKSDVSMDVSAKNPNIATKMDCIASAQSSPNEKEDPCRDKNTSPTLDSSISGEEYPRKSIPGTESSSACTKPAIHEMKESAAMTDTEKSSKEILAGETKSCKETALSSGSEAQQSTSSLSGGLRSHLKQPTHGALAFSKNYKFGGQGLSSATPVSTNSSQKASSGGSSSAAQSIKAKQKALADARKKRLAEMRGKSKPVPLQSQGLANTLTAKTAIGSNSIFSHSKMIKNASASDCSVNSDKKRDIAARMREKAAAAASGSKQGELVPPTKIPHRGKGPEVPQQQTMTTMNLSEPALPQKEVLSPMDTYEISDRDDSDSSESDDDYDSSRKNKKRVPKWAQKPELLTALTKQFSDGPGRCDPDAIFPEVDTCDLEAIFGNKKARYNKRSSTGNWVKDHATAAEKLTYKRTMGYVD